MFKFATNKFTHNSSSNQHGSGSGGGDSTAQNNNSGGSNLKSLLNIDEGLSLTAAMSNSIGGNGAAASRRRQIQKDLFSFNKIADKGFPSKPSAMDYDRKLKLIGMGTKNGDIRIYGAPGTCQQQLACYQDIHPFPILRLLFIQGQYQLITLTERVYRNEISNKGESQLYLVLWQIPNTVNDNHTIQNINLVEKVKEYALDPKIVNGTRLSALTLLNDNSHLFLGFETGDIYVFNVSSFQIVPGVINKDYILKNLPDPTVSNTTTTNTNTTTHKKLTQLGAVESICHHPRQLTKLLLAYQRGLWVIFDFIKNQIDQINQTPHQLESAVFYQAGECVATSHSDGSFILWDLENVTMANTSTSLVMSNSSPPNIVYGPYPCKPVTKCMVKTCRNDQPYVIFSGGCPRVNYSDKITISVIQGENAHVCFDFTSKIIDFFTIDKPFIEKQAVNPTTPVSTSSAPQQTTTVTYDNPQALFVLLEEEFVAIDLISEGWPQYKLPYLYSVHSSAVICTHYVNGVSLSFYERLKQFGDLAQDPSEFYSNKDWPIMSPTVSPSSPTNSTLSLQSKDLLLTGHEDGSIRFWDVTQMSMQLIYRLRTSDYFQTDSTPIDETSTSERTSCINNSSAVTADNWPPFRKVGTFDPYSDDPKLGIQKIYLCPQRHVLVVAGTAGQVLIMNINEQAKELQFSSIQSHKINIIGVSPEVESHFVWKGHEPLALRGRLGNFSSHNTSSSGSSSGAAGSTSNNPAILNGSIKLTPGFQLQSLIQLYPPATVSALTLNTDWQLVGMGTSHGFALFDYLQHRDLLIRCTLDPAMLLAQNPNDSGNTGTTISRRKSLKKSLRESFRKLRRGRSQKGAGQQQKNKTINNNTNQMRVEHIDDDMGDGSHHKPIERQVESREFKPMDDIPPSVIRYMYFVRTFITSSQQQTNSLWVGTNTGVIYIYALQFLNSSNSPAQQIQSLKNTTTSCLVRTNQAINCLLAKEMRLKHRAPVVHIQVIDQQMHPLPNDSGTIVSASNTQADEHQNHKVIICSEEQFKVFQLPTLKPVCKFKLTAVEGARVRRIGYNCYMSRSDPKYSEYCLSCLSNLGDLSVYNLPQLKRQVQIQCMKQQDINAITSFVFSKQGQAFYLQSPSEFVHISMSARDSPQQFLPIQASAQPSVGQQQQNSKRNSVINPQAKQQQQQKPSNPSTTNTNNSNKSTTPQGSSGNTQNKASTQSATPTSTPQPPPPVPAPRTIINSLTAQSNETTLSTNSAISPNSITVNSTSTISPNQSNNSALIPPNRSTKQNLTESKSTVATSSAVPLQQQMESSPPLVSTTTVTNTLLSTTDDPAKSINETILASSNQINSSIISNETKNDHYNHNQSILDKTDLANTSTISNITCLNTPNITSTNNNNITNVTPISINTYNSNNSILSTTSTALFTNSTSSTVNNNNNNNNLVNASSITSQSDISFNASSSGYNGSSILAGGTTSSNFGIDLSMDSVVDRFNEDFNEVSSKRIPLAIDESSISQATNQNDSLLNETEVNDLTGSIANKLTINHSNENGSGINKTNGNQNHNQSSSNNTRIESGQINHTFDNDFKQEANEKLKSPNKKNITAASYQNGTSNTNGNDYKSPKTNGHTNGHIINTNGHNGHHHNGNGHNGHLIGDDEDIHMAPQKASSPLVKTNGNSMNANGHGINGGSRHNKIEQVTKQIENGSKLEYRETAID